MAETPPRKSPPLLLVALALVGAGIAAYFALRKPEPTPQAPPAPVAKEEPAPAPDTPLPSAEERDKTVREQLTDAAPGLGPYLGQKDLLERWVQVANSLAEDHSPREPLSFLAPSERFSTFRTAQGLAIAPKSSARYDWFAGLVSTVDAKKLAAAVKSLHPLLTTAYHSLGYPNQSVDELARRGLSRIVRTPVVEAPVELVESGARYKFKDPKLESLGPVEKHLLRMGAQNERTIQQKASELLDALGLPQPTAKQP